MHRPAALIWIVPLLILSGVLRATRPGAPPWWTFALTLVVVCAFAGVSILRDRRRERRLKRTLFISHARRRRFGP